MFRKIVCILTAAVCIFSFSIPVLAGEEAESIRMLPERMVIDSRDYTNRSEAWTEENKALQLPDFYDLDITVYPIRSDRKGLPETRDYPAPIIMAMVLSLLVVVLMVFVDNRRK